MAYFFCRPKGMPHGESGQAKALNNTTKPR